jgi:hypothetical protein
MPLPLTMLKICERLFGFLDHRSRELLVLLTLDRSVDILPFLSDVYRKAHEETES